MAQNGNLREAEKNQSTKRREKRGGDYLEIKSLYYKRDGL